MKHALPACVGAIALATALNCNAEPIFDTMANPNVPNGGILGTPTVNVTAAADFEVTDIAGLGFSVLTGLKFWAFHADSGITWPGTLTYTIWGDDDASPSTPIPDTSMVIKTGVAANVDQTPGGSTAVPPAPGGYSSYTWTADIAPTKLFADARYWLGLNFGAGTSGIFWQYTTSQFGRPRAIYERADIPGTWTTYGGDVAFELTGVPVPATAFLLMIGLPGVLLGGRLKRQFRSTTTRG